jgi:hypothetical protein
MKRRFSFARLLTGLGAISTLSGFMLAFRPGTASASGSYTCSGTAACVAGTNICTITCSSKCTCTNS